MSVASSPEAKADEAIACFIPGDVFGEFTLFEGDPRTAHAMATEDSRLLGFRKEGRDFEWMFGKKDGSEWGIIYKLHIGDDRGWV